MKTFWLSLLLLLTFVSKASATNCTEKPYRAFDFWLGHWQVTTTSDNIIRSSKISSINDGCTLLEEYSTPSGYQGKSLNIYDKHSKKWHQTWTDNTGLLLILTGERIGNKMILTGTSSQQGKQVFHQIIWTANPNGTVRQHWQSRKTIEDQWKTAFDGLYTKKNSTNN